MARQPYRIGAVPSSFDRTIVATEGRRTLGRTTGTRFEVTGSETRELCSRYVHFRWLPQGAPLSSPNGLSELDLLSNVYEVQCYSESAMTVDRQVECRTVLRSRCPNINRLGSPYRPFSLCGPTPAQIYHSTVYFRCTTSTCHYSSVREMVVFDHLLSQIG